ncbi:hypothetical protein M885DRAFT_411990, partial [Pelagophyceae sp. CCMP2097]
HFLVLQLCRDFDDQELKSQFRAASKHHHPDRGGSYAAFQRVSLAHDTLADPQRLLQHD